MTAELVQAEEALGFSWSDHQREAFDGWMQQTDTRACLYFKTGAGKSITSLMMMRLRGEKTVLVVAPPSTHAAWHKQAQQLGLAVDTISHAKFRMKDYKLSRSMPLIVDEFHMLGGHSGKGWKKLDTLARHLQAPLVICSATPNYNDAERVYCIQHVLDPHSAKGGYLQFLYQNCVLEHDPFSATPKVTGFLRHKDAAEYLASLPGVYYLPDDLVYTIKEVPYSTPLDDAFTRYSYNSRDHRIMASGMEQRHTATFQQLVNEDEYIHAHVMALLDDILFDLIGSVLIYCNHATVALALAATLRDRRTRTFGLVTGGMSTKAKEQEIQMFRDGKFKVLIGTASLATGTDGLDKMCDTLIIFDDTDDPSLRRQVIGRIMPRGADTDASKKKVFRFLHV